MIIWLNGTFGAGKTSVAAELVRRLPRAVLFDPELIGELLEPLLPNPTGDFQDLAAWRRIVVATVDALRDEPAPGPIVIPMTVMAPKYAEEIFGGLGRPALHVLLDAGDAELRRRIATADPGVDAAVRTARRQWRAEHLRTYLIERPAMAARADLVVDTTHRTVAQAADAVLAHPHASPGNGE
ncbi:AAA family ATPase [Micromonospora sp. DT43]|uniref:AAA family ATPase n=1 Tax=Micromonospora sp. DT43 TaxID=3393440 RepID=UPI003CF28DB9